MILTITHNERDAKTRIEARKWIRKNADVFWEFSNGTDFQLKDEKKIAWAMLKFGAKPHRTWVLLRNSK